MSQLIYTYRIIQVQLTRFEDISNSVGYVSIFMGAQIVARWVANLESYTPTKRSNAQHLVKY